MGRAYAARRRQRYSSRRHAIVEKERQGVRIQLGTEVEAVEAHEPAHETGCLRCFVARQHGDAGEAVTR